MATERSTAVERRALALKAAESRLRRRRSAHDVIAEVNSEPQLHSSNLADTAPAGELSNSLASQNLCEAPPASNQYFEEEDLSCPICFQTFLEPVSLACGHSYCRECLSRAISSRAQCPLCRIPTGLSPESLPKTNLVLKKLVEKYFPELLKARVRTLTAAEAMNTETPTENTTRRSDGSTSQRSDSDANTPNSASSHRIYIFLFSALVCPGSFFSLNLFEPRYTQMLERILNSGSRLFGMQNDHSDERGFLMEIVEVQRATRSRWHIRTKCVGRYKCRHTTIEGTFGGSSLYVTTATKFNDAQEAITSTAMEPGQTNENDSLHELFERATESANVILDHLDASARSRLLQRSPRTVRNAELASLWMCSWLKIPASVLRNSALSASIHNRRDLVLDCESTRERLKLLLLSMECGALAMAQPNGQGHIRIERFLDIDGTEFIHRKDFFSPIKQLLLIVVFCVSALYFARVQEEKAQNL